MRALLSDRRRSQRGSVLSGVLIITAFLAIVSGALMSELSSSFLLSRNLVNRVAAEATINSAMEIAMEQLGSTPISAGCVAPSTVSLNRLTAVSSYVRCFPVVDSRSPQFTRIASAAFQVAGTHAILPASGLNEYVAGDTGGAVHGYVFGRPNGWTVDLGGAVTAAPAAMTDPTGRPDVSVAVPVVDPTVSAPGCGSTQACVALLSGAPGVTPTLRCYMNTSNPQLTSVVASPAQGLNFPNLVYFGDTSGDMYAFDATANGGCAFQDYAPKSNEGAIVAGPVVFNGPPDHQAATDVMYTVSSTGAGSEVDEYTYDVNNPNDQHLPLTEVGFMTLPYPDAVGLAVDRTTLPANLAITFAGGQVAVVQIQSNYRISTVASTSLGTGISAAPFWCHCAGGSANVIGVGGQNGSLFLLDPTLARLATLPAGGPAIATAPQSDGVGDWFFGASDGYLYEAQQTGGSGMAIVTRFGSLGGPVGSGTQVGACPAGLCVYLGSAAGGAYLVTLDARSAVITSCLTNAPPACSGTNPRLWADLEIGTAGSPQSVHIMGWSYYSP